jgi:hypothetical protein
MVLAFSLVYAILLQSAQGPPGPGPSVATDIGLLVTVILCVYIGFRVMFAGKEAKSWKKGAWFIFGLICCSVLLGFLSFAVFVDGASLGPYWLQAYPATVNNISMAWHFLLVIAVILGLAAVLALILILDQAEMERVKRKYRYVKGATFATSPRVRKQES